MLSICSDPSRLFFSPPPPPPLWRSAASRPLAVAVAVFSSHSNPRILKPNRRSPYGRLSSPYDDDDDEFDEYDDEEEEGGEEEDEGDESQPSDDEFSDLDDSGTSQHSGGKHLNLSSSARKKRSGKQRPLRKDQQERPLSFEPTLKLALDSTYVKPVKIKPKKINSTDCQYATYRSEMDFDLDSKVKVKDGTFTENNFQMLTEELDFDRRWFPLIDYLNTYGLKESHFLSIYERHMPSLQINLVSAKERLEFLMSVGVKHRDIKRILVRQPQILEYTVENNLKSHVAFLTSIGVPNCRIGHVITSAPSLFSYSVEHSLKPTIRYLIEEVGIKESDVSKIVQLSPQILVQRIDNSWNSHSFFLSKEIGAPRDSIVKMVKKHPQLLHYSIEDGILPRINFLRSIGMSNADILKVVTNLTQRFTTAILDQFLNSTRFSWKQLKGFLHGGRLGFY